MTQDSTTVEHANGDDHKMYGNIDHIDVDPIKIEGQKVAELGGGGGPVVGSDSIMRYVAGCITRERERLARIFINQKSPEEVAKAILDSSLDDLIFKWVGPSARLDDRPVSLAEREAEKTYRPDAT